MIARVALASLAFVSASIADTVRITLAEDLRTAGSSGRVILFMTSQASRRVASSDPANAPFFSDPQPVASIAASDFRPGMTIELGEGAGTTAWPAALSALDGAFRVQAVFKCNPDEGSHRAAGNVYSEPKLVSFAPDREDVVELRLTGTFPGEKRVDGANLRYVKVRSDLLSRFRGRETFLRAGVALPPGWDSPLSAEKRWPAIYIVPGFGGRDTEAESYARMLATKGIVDVAPMAVHIVLDPEGPYGHHGFSDSDANGPVGTALLTELLPALEGPFRLDPRPAARIVTGHSSGGWTALHLAIGHPEVFGACWASAPDPIDFSAFQLTDLYREPSLFVDAAGADTPSFRVAVAPGVERPRMTVRQEIGVEHAMAPAGDSGQQWGAWLAMFSPIDPATGRPRWVADPRTGAIDRQVVEQSWSRHDLAKIVERDWERAKTVLPTVRLVVGVQDSFYLERAVRRFAERFAPRLSADATLPPMPAGGAVPDGEVRLGAGPGYIWFVRHATHENVVPLTTLRWNLEMREWLGQKAVQPSAR